MSVAADEHKPAHSAFGLPARPLKSISVVEIEREFAAALKRLTGASYSVELGRLDYGEGFTAAIFDTAQLALKVSRQPEATGI